ncbi:hypothetical protein OEZ86_004596 [Tetradesmus obliquus]|nr:hypothetical protein OEZ86_004596 [Tetradesmus obliquus]
MDQLLPLLLGGWLAVVCISAAADKTRKWCDAHADEPMAEVVGLLPAALENPTRFAVTSLAATRVLRTLAGLVQQYVQQFTPNWVSPVDALAQGIAAALGPLDQMLLSLYVVLAVAVTTRAAQGSRSSSSSSSRSGSSSRRQRSGKWFVGKSADDLERLLLPLDGVLSWVLVVVAGLLTAQALGINIKPLLAVGGASSIIIGLATQTLLSNAVTGLSIFLSRPFVAGDSITVQSTRHVIVSGTVERITPLRTLMRTDDDVLVTVPNKIFSDSTISDMVIYNRSRRDARRRFKMRNMKERQMMKFKVRQPHKELHQLEELQDALRQQLRRPGVAQQNVEVALSKFSDVGAELLVRFLLLVAPASPEGQRLLLDLSLTARQYGATLVSIM